MLFDTSSFADGFSWGLTMTLSAGLVGVTINAVMTFFKTVSGG